jgi:hypothetical protein
LAIKYTKGEFGNDGVDATVVTGYACNASYYISEFDFENAEKQFDQC